MILVGVPFDNPTEFIPFPSTLAQVKNLKKPDKPLIVDVNFKIDCSKIGKSSIDNLQNYLKKFLKVQLIGNDTIYATGKASRTRYNHIWGFIDLFDVKVIF